ncbi:MAG: hypothetical protein Q4C48_11210 [Lachnospiraceae bacterium]|nr:hypothetical protein [Lachnospiraceae bacterium]
MTKKNFITLILTTVGGLLFALGMCMALLPEWDAFTQGVVVGCAGMVVLAVMLLVRLKMEGRSIRVKLSARTVGIFLLGIAGTLGLGVGMCMVMVWDMLVLGILVGIVGIVLLLCLIPAVMGLK